MDAGIIVACAAGLAMVGLVLWLVAREPDEDDSLPVLYAARQKALRERAREEWMRRHNERREAIKRHCESAPVVTLDITSPYYRAPIDDRATWQTTTITTRTTPAASPCAYCGRVGAGGACAGCGAPPTAEETRPFAKIVIENGAPLLTADCEPGERP